MKMNLFLSTLLVSGQALAGAGLEKEIACHNSFVQADAPAVMSGVSSTGKRGVFVYTTDEVKFFPYPQGLVTGNEQHFRLIPRGELAKPKPRPIYVDVSYYRTAPSSTDTKVRDSGNENDVELVEGAQELNDEIRSRLSYDLGTELLRKVWIYQDSPPSDKTPELLQKLKDSIEICSKSNDAKLKESALLALETLEPKPTPTHRHGANGQ